MSTVFGARSARALTLPDAIGRSTTSPAPNVSASCALVVLDRRLRAHDLHGLSGLADLQHDREIAARVQLNGDAARRGLETGELGGELVSAHAHDRKAQRALRVRDRLVGRRCVHMPDGDTDTGKNGIGRVPSPRRQRTLRFPELSPLASAGMPAMDRA